MSYKFNTFCRKYSLLLVLMLLLQVSFAQTNFNKIDDWLNYNVKELGGRTTLVIYKDGKIIYDTSVNNLGWRQKMIGRFLARRQGKEATDSALNFTDSSKVPIASCSKWLSAALVMTFVDEGKLNLEDSIGKYLPMMNKYGKGGIKIKYCLSHLTGIKSGSLKDSRDLIINSHTMDDAIASIAKQPMEGEPGKTFHYSSAGLQIAAAIIEKIGGKDFNTLFEERIAKPCNMFNTDFGDARVPLAAGSALSTPLDYLNFLVMLLNDGNYNGVQVLSKKSVIEMEKNRITKDAVIAYTPLETNGWGYGYGEWIMDDSIGDERSDDISSPGLFGSFPWVDNKDHYAAFLLTLNLQYKGRREKYTQLKQLVDEAIQ
jgi:CubicO group peptidase (beta-lactamase class C family)